MTVSKALIAAIRADCPGGDLDDWIARHLKLIQKTQEGIASCRHARAKAKEDYDARLEQIQRDEKSIESKCCHWAESYHGDPAGGSDSFYQCDVCGRER